MMKRWIIRSLFLLPLLCGVGLWVGSYWQGVYVDCFRPKGRSSLGTEGGFLWFQTSELPGSVGFKWHWGYDEPNPVLSDQSYHGCPYHFAGFAYEAYPESLHGHHFMVHLWFPTLLSAVLFWFVWRKTKPKPLGRAFPIEPTAKPGESKP